MVDGSAIPVIAGLAIGIAFVVMFSQVFIPVTALTDEELIERTKSLEEVQLFFEMHPDSEIEIERDDARSNVDVRYSVTKQIHEPRGWDSGIKSRDLIVTVNSFGDTDLRFVCGGGGRGTVNLNPTVDTIANWCILEPETDVEYAVVSPDLPRYPVE